MHWKLKSGILMAMEAKKLLTQNSMDTILVLEFISLTLISAPSSYRWPVTCILKQNLTLKTYNSKSENYPRSYGVMAITLDFESNNPSSNLGRTSLFFRQLHHQQIMVDEVISLTNISILSLSRIQTFDLITGTFLLVMTSLQSLPEAPPTSFRHII